MSILLYHYILLYYTIITIIYSRILPLFPFPIIFYDMNTSSLSLRLYIIL